MAKKFRLLLLDANIVAQLFKLDQGNRLHTPDMSAIIHM